MLFIHCHIFQITVPNCWSSETYRTNVKKFSDSATEDMHFWFIHNFIQLMVRMNEGFGLQTKPSD